MERKKTEKKTEWKKPRAFSLSNDLFAALKIMAEDDGTSMSLEVCKLIAREWEKRVNNGDRMKMLEKLRQMKEEIQ